MTVRITGLIIALAGLLAAGVSAAAVTGVRATPRQVTIVGSGGNVVAISWQVSTTPDHRAGVSSAAATIIDPATGIILQRIGTPLDAAVGAGPYTLREQITLDAATVRGWIEQGLVRVVVERSFTDPATGGLTAASVVLSLRASRLQATREAAPSELDVIALRLEFDSGSNVEVVDIGETLRALLTVQYTGTGVLQGRWQIAEPESSEGVPVYRTLALVNSNLQTNQRSTLQSPALPSERPGKYLLRFCVTMAQDAGFSGDTQCPDADLIAVATYQVRLADAAGVINGIWPDRQTVAPATPFRWNAVTDASVYQLQVFEYPVPGGEPQFVTGMLLASDSSTTLLSELVRSRLAPGRRYLWRVSAHDSAGNMLARSPDASFVYAPGR